MPFPDNNKNLYGFRKIIGDYARPHLFMVQIGPIISSFPSEEITCFARTAKLPDYKIGSTDIEFQGLKYKIATVPEQGGSISLEFLSDEKHTLRGKFLQWLAQIADASKITFGSVAEYKSDQFFISQLDRTGKRVLTYSFIGVFPKSCGEISLSHGETTPEKFSVEFDYDYFTITYGTGAPVSNTGTDKSAVIDAPASPEKKNFKEPSF